MSVPAPSYFGNAACAGDVKTAEEAVAAGF
jgi:hypothetical protein